MKILYAIQGTGNGHLSRSRDLIKKLEDYCEVDVLMSGIQVELKTDLEIKYRLHGLSFIFGKQGGINFAQTFKKNSLFRFFREIRQVPIRDYDLVINDFEPVSAWAAFLNGVPCYALSNQCVTLHSAAPKSRNFDPLGKLILRYYAPSDEKFGFHLDRYSPNIYFPVIRKEFMEAELIDKGHYTVYLAAYGDEHIIDVLSRFKTTHWEVFSKRAKEERQIGNILIRPVSNEDFIESFRTSRGIICNSGFQTITEALFMGKKILSIPMKAQYEQQCIAEALTNIGASVIPSFGLHQLAKISDWIENGPVIQMNYRDHRDQILRDILLHYVKSGDPYTEYLEEGQYSVA